MEKNAATALAAIGRANLALGEQWLEISAAAVGHAQRMHRAAFQSFYTGPLFAAPAVMASGASAAMHELGTAGMLQQWMSARETLELLSNGLPTLVAEYAGDMNSIAPMRDVDVDKRD
jgi:hypothetical protein